MGITEKCEMLFQEIQGFAENYVQLNDAIKDNRLELFEKMIGYTLPVDYKYMLKRHNGFSVMGTEVNGIDLAFRGSSMDTIYFDEHSANNTLPTYFVPISYDGRGNFYCLDLSKSNNGLSPVVFWQSDYLYGRIEDVEVTNESFIDWVQEVMIDWNLES